MRKAIRNRARYGLAALTGLVCACAPAQTPAPAASQAALEHSIFDTRTAPRFGDPTQRLQTLLSRDETRPVGPQHVCVVGYRWSDGDMQAWIHWQEGRRLILWDGSDPDYPAEAIGMGRRYLSLDKDVVATEADINSSTYLVTRAWADGVIADCARAGARYTVMAVAARGE